jgi:hypothetical protein
MEAVFVAENLAVNYQTARCREPHEHDINIHRHVNLKSYILSRTVSNMHVK